MRRAAKIDANQPDIVKALRAAGYSVADTSGAGEGFPDLVVSSDCWTCLLEVKDGSKTPSARKLTPAQQDFHAAWRGPIFVVLSPEQALRVMATRGAKI